MGIEKEAKLLKENQALKAEIKKWYNSKVINDIKRIEELDQNKLYFIVLENAGGDEIETFKDYISLIKYRLRWSTPNIIILNKPLKKLSLEELEQLIKLKNNEK